ncbi:hypothetical protein RB195_015811 [Necator americanus]|uniref:Uncharacterized protein n=1 Tax=Necator americanus TaxID=51031 RepID=A0ABR1E698_NECAM
MIRAFESIGYYRPNAVLGYSIDDQLVAKRTRDAIASTKSAVSLISCYHDADSGVDSAQHGEGCRFLRKIIKRSRNPHRQDWTTAHLTAHSASITMSDQTVRSPGLLLQLIIEYHYAHTRKLPPYSYQSLVRPQHPQFRGMLPSNPHATFLNQLYIKLLQKPTIMMLLTLAVFEVKSNITVGNQPFYENILVDMKKEILQCSAVSLKIFTAAFENAVREPEWNDMEVKEM